MTSPSLVQAERLPLAPPLPPGRRALGGAPGVAAGTAEVAGGAGQLIAIGDINGIL
jgi:hypothetical protein